MYNQGARPPRRRPQNFEIMQVKFVLVPPEEDATPFHTHCICFRLCVFAGAEVKKVCQRCLERDAKMNYEKLHYAEYI